MAALVVPGVAGRLAAEMAPEQFMVPSLAMIAGAVIKTARDGTADAFECCSSIIFDGRTDEVLEEMVMELVASGDTYSHEQLVRMFDECVWLHARDRRLARARAALHRAAVTGDWYGELIWLSRLQAIHAERRPR